MALDKLPDRSHSSPLSCQGNRISPRIVVDFFLNNAKNASGGVTRPGVHVWESAVRPSQCDGIDPKLTIKYDGQSREAEEPFPKIGGDGMTVTMHWCSEGTETETR